MYTDVYMFSTLFEVITSLGRRRLRRFSYLLQFPKRIAWSFYAYVILCNGFVRVTAIYA